MTVCVCPQNSLSLEVDLRTDARKESRQLIILENSNGRVYCSSELERNRNLFSSALGKMLAPGCQTLHITYMSHWNKATNAHIFLNL